MENLQGGSLSMEVLHSLVMICFVGEGTLQIEAVI